jgi:hypothetical protein
LPDSSPPKPATIFHAPEPASAKRRRSIAERLQGVYGRLRPTPPPGEYLTLDTQNLDMFAMDPVTCRWAGVQLTITQGLFSRCAVGLHAVIAMAE